MDKIETITVLEKEMYALVCRVQNHISDEEIYESIKRAISRATWLEE